MFKFFKQHQDPEANAARIRKMFSQCGYYAASKWARKYYTSGFIAAALNRMI